MSKASQILSAFNLLTTSYESKNVRNPIAYILYELKRRKSNKNLQRHTSKRQTKKTPKRL